MFLHGHPTIKVPKTSPSVIIIPYEELGNKFDTSAYSPALTDGRASLEEINQVLNDLEATRAPFTSKILGNICYYILSTFLMIGAIALCAAFVKKHGKGMLVLIICSVVMYIAVIIVLTKRSKRLNAQLIAECKAVADRHNSSFASRGLRWYVPSHFPRWVELWKDYNRGQAQTQGQGQPIYVPPVNQQPISHQTMEGQPQPQFQQNYYQGQGHQDMYVPPPPYQQA
jgi:hypothetical protein